MPIYEYRCQECEQRFEKLVLSIDREPAHLACPACGSPDVQRLISRVSVASGGDAPSGGEAEARTPGGQSRSGVFGRKELNQALKDSGY
ncbi:MAG: zinc ribbon domain-containing protein [Anaerolineae bacterium]